MRTALVTLVAACALAVAAAPAGATLQGTVFMDFNANGRQDAGGFVAGASAAATDNGVAGVVVSAYDASGARVATATTAADGSYALATTGSGTVRVVFETPPGYASSLVGEDTASSVRFVAANAAGPVDYGITRGGEYCQDNPRLVTCAMPYLANYPVSAAGAVTLDSRLGPLTIGQRGESLGGTPATPTKLNSPSDLGAVWGVGVDRGGNAYFGTYVKRHSPYGPGSNGANGNANWIYKVDIGTGATTPWIRLGINTLPAHVAMAPTGWPAYSADGLRSDGNSSDVFHLVGRAGIGDVDVAPDGSTLYAVEMTQADPKLWRVPIVGRGDAAAAGEPSSVSIPRPTGLNGVSCDGSWHPMGLGMTADAILVGGVCQLQKPRTALTITSSQSVPGGSEGPAPGTSNLGITFSAAHGLDVGDLVTLESFARGDGQCALTDPLGPRAPNWLPPTNFFEVKAVTSTTAIVIDTGHWRCAGHPADATTGTVALFAGRQLSAFVLRHDPATGAFTPLAAVDLDYDKAMSAEWFDATALHKYDSYGLSFDWAYKKLSYWRAWNDWDPLPGELSLSTAAQPMLANIETQADGHLVLGLRDRWLDQTGAAYPIDYDSAPGSPQLSRSYNASADILVLCKTGSGYAMERNGACGADTGASMPRLLDGETDPNVRADSPLYHWNGYVDSESTGVAVRHPYTGQGGIAQMPGGVLWTTAYDIVSINEQGVRALGPCASRTGRGACGPAGAADGAILGGTRFTASGSTASCGRECWGKGNGLGDLELVCDAAPVQIGNRVWIDADRNGIQDAGELPVAGVTVRLYDAAGTLVGTALTDADGLYTFSSNVTKPAAGDGTSAGGGLTAGAAFTVRLDNAADFAVGGPLHGYALTTADVATQGAAVNSKATFVGGGPAIAIPARQAGENDHTFDVGFAAPRSDAPTAAAQAASAGSAGVLVAIGNRVWVDRNGDGLQGERPLGGVQVVLLTERGRRARDAAGRTVPPATTDRRGRYVFDGLAPGRYRVRFVLPVGYRFTRGAAASATRDSNPVPTKANPLVGVTPVFEVHGAVRGATVRNADPRIDAGYIDPTIDAGVVVWSQTGGGEPVTG